MFLTTLGEISLHLAPTSLPHPKKSLARNLCPGSTTSTLFGNSPRKHRQTIKDSFQLYSIFYISPTE
ncbi:hypothetical protein XENTR_v10007911 [Xenopus tropicalis]|nr:hypothetical protein XENTR_v10007911 [Xenopus tropicalis]